MVFLEYRVPQSNYLFNRLAGGGEKKTSYLIGKRIFQRTKVVVPGRY